MNRLALADRPKAYYNIDGVGELGLGFMLSAFALLQWLQVQTSNDSFWHRWYGFAAYVVAMSSIIHFGSKAIKNRITYPRTGFVEYRKRGAGWQLLNVGLGGLIVLCLVLLQAMESHLGIPNPDALLGLLISAAYAYGVARTIFWKWIPAWMMAASSVGIAILPGKLAGFQAYMLWSLIAGVVMLISGAVSFWLYLRNTHAPVEAE